MAHSHQVSFIPHQKAVLKLHPTHDITGIIPVMIEIYKSFQMIPCTVHIRIQGARNKKDVATMDVEEDYRPCSGHLRPKSRSPNPKSISGSYTPHLWTQATVSAPAWCPKAFWPQKQLNASANLGKDSDVAQLMQHTPGIVLRRGDALVGVEEIGDRELDGEEEDGVAVEATVW
ncbi:hypothetical protein C8Q78DRAFT_988730 [Trametes maxima]|nr:hypothetical protein C8Q78DRAFT_988730 [Trametes maxima]